MNVAELSHEVLSALHERGRTDQEIAHMSLSEVFDDYCNWHGMIHMGDQLLRVVTDLQKADKASADKWSPAEHSQAVARADRASVPAESFTEDDLGFLQTADTKVLAAVARNELDLNQKAAETLANRGMNADGQWVGFPAAKVDMQRRFSASELASIQGFGEPPKMLLESAPCAGHSMPTQKPVQEVPRAVIWMEGGLVQGVMSGSPLEVAVIDYDTEGVDESDLFDVDQTDGTISEATGSIRYVEIDKERTDQLFFTVEEAEQRFNLKP